MPKADLEPENHTASAEYQCSVLAANEIPITNQANSKPLPANKGIKDQYTWILVSQFTQGR